MGKERRGHTRHSVFGGNAEIMSVFGRGRAPADRARIVNWSRGGLLLKVASPRRRLVFLKQEPVLYEHDTIDCVVRLAPAYNSIEVHGEVRHVVADPQDKDQLLVGVAFDAEKTSEQALEQLAKTLEPKSRSGRVRKISASQERVTGRLRRAEPASGGRAEPGDGGTPLRTSGRHERDSQRLKRSARLQRD